MLKISYYRIEKYKGDSLIQVVNIAKTKDVYKVVQDMGVDCLPLIHAVRVCNSSFVLYDSFSDYLMNKCK